MARSASSPAYLKVLEKLREFCSELPETTESISWGKPHFRVAKKIFLGAYEEDGRVIIGLQLEMGHAAKVVEDPRFWAVGKKGGVCMDVSKVKNWSEVRDLVRESYYVLAPTNLAKQLLESGSKPVTKSASKPSTKSVVKSPTKSASKSRSKVSSNPSMKSASKPTQRKKTSK